MNLTDAIWRNSFEWPERLALLIDDQQWTFGVLRQYVSLVAARLAQNGIKRGDCVAVTVRDPLTYLMVVLATARLGVIATPYPADQTDEFKRLILERHSVRLVLCGVGEQQADAALDPECCLDILKLFKPPAPGETIPAPPFAADVDDEPWLIVRSSGTTGLPKSVARTHRREAMQCVLTLPEKAARDEHRPLVFMGLSLGVGISTVLSQLYAARTVVLTRSVKPQEFFRAVERSRPTHAWMSAGNVSSVVAYAAANLPHSATVCKSLESISLMGAAVPPALRTEIEQRVCSHLQIFYGSTEAGFVSEAASSMLAKHPAATGRILPWVQAQVVDEDDNLLPIGKPGVLRFKTPSMADGYVQDAQNTARAFRDGWFYPGDMGTIDVAGNMTLAGRVDLLLNVGGNKVNPETIEEQLNKHPAILESAVVLLTRDQGMPTLVALVVQKTSIDTNDLMRWCLEHLPRNRVPTQFVVVPELLKNAAGKLMRAEMTKATRWSQAPVPHGAESRH